MPKMTARYARPKKLNVRAEPSKDAKVVRKMHDGDSEECFGVKDGWAKLRDGYAMAKFLEIEEEPAKKAAKAVGKPAEQPDVAEPAFGDPERAVLRSKTVAELRELAEQSGISLKKGAKKEEIIDALLSDD